MDAKGGASNNSEYERSIFFHDVFAVIDDVLVGKEQI